MCWDLGWRWDERWELGAGDGDDDGDGGDDDDDGDGSDVMLVVTIPGTGDPTWVTVHWQELWESSGRALGDIWESSSRALEVLPHTMNQKSSQNIIRNSCFEHVWGRLAKFANLRLRALGKL